MYIFGNTADIKKWYYQYLIVSYTKRDLKSENIDMFSFQMLSRLQTWSPGGIFFTTEEKQLFSDARFNTK